MSYKIIIDSCGELPEELKQDSHFESVPLTLRVDDFEMIDDSTFDQKLFLKKVAESPNVPKSACPSPEAYMKACQTDAEDVFIVTLSAKLSGSYNSAVLGRELYLEEAGEKNIYVVNSRSASVGQTLIGKKAAELEEAGYSFSEVVKRIEQFTDEMRTYFVLESLETLRKAGRLSNLKAFVAGKLQIKPLMGSDPEGGIVQLATGRGMKKTLDLLVNYAIDHTQNQKEKILAISHCNCPERAAQVKERFEQMGEFKEIMVLNTAGVSTLYAGDGGIIVTV